MDAKFTTYTEKYYKRKNKSVVGGIISKNKEKMQKMNWYGKGRGTNQERIAKRKQQRGY